ncbi:RNA 2',3'-cyclic phosphodiesterase [Paenibacillus sp. N3.4]|uniref:RNA 2',3'-cyclic phosphodiesterase n=1 Tax=Paenibacillus sp. N3.4 TaxID=2603222 RepID=UPI0011C8ADC2|nr:RNA 2',3'-cyclic phosphodiesterase [Paenibacillus sp. N3.4]TXK85144.1 RNA 2',3'-cyclic phosphodiesterase [Paenibacillus sp. N3.4]
MMKSMGQPMRLFVAIPVPEQVGEKLEQWTKANRERLPFRKWTHVQDYHITIQFLGETTIEKMDALQIALRNIKSKPISLVLNGVGFFGTPKAPRVLWAAVSGDLLALNSLHTSVIQATHALGYVAEDRPYAAHMTLARSYAGENEFLAEALKSAPKGIEWKSDNFILMRTHMNASPMYETIGSFPLLET